MANAVKKIVPNEVANDSRPSTALTPMEMVGRALEMGVSADILKQMMDLRDREESRNARIAFTKAVAAAKAEIKPILKTREVDYTPQGKQRVNYRHEDLAGIEEQVSPILIKYGLHYRFESDNGPDRPLTITCVLEHEDGYSTRTPLSAGADNSGGKNSLQAIASAATYLQRYTLKLALGLSVSHDDDGMKATETEEPKRITEGQVEIILDLLEETDSDVERFCKMGKIDAVPDMLASDFDDAVRLLRQRKAKMRNDR
ncbi:ERF family protein [Rhizobium bangladeshense]|uniref:ERF family protein n=1 Tax=Rhizobium bangladeshense TaxID=1138189 RepID=UPI001C83E9CD|nr:ERF family protein [Rhizobium bangladeshense]MBX4870617.1 ERF family protein [Rhizobium bangladeshense]MBX4872668.1 ERF family protein [Rhizobium bangladeshense]